jgi:DNA-directed RNA polymerase subunit beta'
MRDITGGLPRVTELFEARAPQNPAVVSDIDGTITFKQAKRGQRGIVVTSLDGQTTTEYTVPSSKYVLVQEGDLVRAGDRLTDGSINPHDILRIKGVGAVQEYLVNEIQEVYRMQGVKINDKHIEVIVRQMLQKVRIVDSGDSTFLFNDQVDRLKFLDENEVLKSQVVVDDKGDSRFKVGQLVPKKRFKEVNVELAKKEKLVSTAVDAEPSTGEPLLLGITQASLTTESWLSASSFQETTRVLADASIASKIDTLSGLKENIIIGQLVPAGTGLRHYHDMIVTSEVGNIFGGEMISEQQEDEAEGTDGFRRLGRRRISV